MSRFLDALRSGRVLLMDGAMGTELQKRGLQAGENSAAWNALQQDRVRAVHQSYIDARAEVLLTNTIAILAQSYTQQINARRLDWSLPYDPVLMDATAWPSRYCIALSLLGAAEVFRVISAGPHFDHGLREYDAHDSTYYFCSEHRPEYELFHLPPDAILFETWSTPRVRYPIRQQRRRLADFPILLSLTYRRDADGKLRTADGHSPQWFAKRAAKYGADALGVNCGKDIGMDECIEIVRRYRQETDLPLFARPNAGTPVQKGDRWVYPHTPAIMAERLPELLAEGVSMVGGCCGTTPEHIAAFRPVVDAWNAGQR